jgi:hypothetical protein
MVTVRDKPEWRSPPRSMPMPTTAGVVMAEFVIAESEPIK